MNHPPLQEKTSPFPGGIIPIYRRARKETSPFPGYSHKPLCCKVLMCHILSDRRQSSLFPGGIIPIYGMAASHCYIGVLLNHLSLRENSIIRVSRVIEYGSPGWALCPFSRYHEKARDAG